MWHRVAQATLGPKATPVSSSQGCPAGASAQGEGLSMAALVFTHTLILTQGVQSRTSTATTLNVPETQTQLINLFVCSSDLYAATFQEGYKAAEIDLRNPQRQEPGHTLLYVCQGDTTPALLSSRCRRDGGWGKHGHPHPTLPRAMLFPCAPNTHHACCSHVSPAIL